MAKVCELSGTHVMHGNNVSHSNRKTRRVFLPNLQKKKFFSFVLGANITFRVTANTIKTIDVKGGIDQYLMRAKSENLSPRARKIKQTFLKKQIAAYVQNENIS